MNEMNIKKMDTNRREYDNNIYIKTKLCIYIFYIYIYSKWGWDEAVLHARSRRYDAGLNFPYTVPVSKAPLH